MMLGKKRFQYSTICIAALMCFSCFAPSSLWAGQKNDEIQDKSADEKLSLELDLPKDDFVYKLANRPDPFVPFYTGEKVQKDPNEIVDSDEQLVGMQLFEPGQLTLVGMMKVHNTYEAMAQDSKGQGYILREGMKIGKRGQIKQIVANKVLIEETATTRSGKILRNEVVMTLRKKEGER